MTAVGFSGVPELHRKRGTFMIAVSLDRVEGETIVNRIVVVTKFSFLYRKSAGPN